MSSTVVVLGVTLVAVGIGVWILLSRKQRRKHKPKNTPKLNNFYEKIIEATPETPRAPLPSLYTTNHYRGPMGVAVPIGAIKPPGVVSAGSISSVNLDAPLREVTTSWTKIGLLVQDHKLLNLWSRPIIPLQDIFQYQAEDKNGFIIPLRDTRYLEDGDVVNNIPGKPGVWRVDLFQTSKYVWM